MIDFSNDVAAVRRFNRFHTRKAGALDEGLLASAFSLPEARVLYEIAQSHDGVTAADLGRSFGLDPGYLSRLLAGLGTRGLIDRAPSKTDARQSLLSLSKKGRAAFSALDERSARDVAAWLAPLSPSQRKRLVGAMATIEALLGESKPAAGFVLRAHQPGDMGWIVHRQGLLYAEEYGWDQTYEALVAEIVAKFIKEFDPRRERCWIAERDGEIAGSVFAVRDSDTVAKLRLLFVDPSARGLGIGRRLVDECIRFARGAGYERLTLWTNDVLVSARRIYDAAGFRVVSQGRHKSFGKDLVAQTWELTL